MLLSENTDMVITIVVLIGLIIVFIGSIIYRHFYYIPYKNNVIKKYLLEINPNITYLFEDNNSGFKEFNKKYHLINAATTFNVTDVIVDDAMKSFDLHATHTQSSGKTSTTVTDFKGRFYDLKIDTKYDCDFILKEEMLNRAPEGFSLLDLELTIFNKKFNLYVSDREAAHHFFTPYAIKRLVELETKCAGDLIFAYINEHLYFGVNDNSNFFEKLQTKEDVQKEYILQRDKILGFKALLERVEEKE